MGILQSSTRAVRLTVLLAVLASLAGCIPIDGVQYGSTQETAESDQVGDRNGSHDPALAPLKITGVVVGFVGTGMIVENHSPQSLKSVVIVVNEGDELGEYSCQVVEMRPHTPK